MKKILNEVRKFIVLALFILSVIVLIGESESVVYMIITKTIALVYFYMFLKANKVLEV